MDVLAMRMTSHDDSSLYSVLLHIYVSRLRTQKTQLKVGKPAMAARPTNTLRSGVYTRTVPERMRPRCGPPSLPLKAV